MHFNAMFRFFINTMTVERHYFGQKSKPQPNSINKISLTLSLRNSWYQEFGFNADCARIFCLFEWP